MQFSGVITADSGDVCTKCQGRRSKVKVTEVKNKFALIWVFPDRNSSFNPQMAMK